MNNKTYWLLLLLISILTMNFQCGKTYIIKPYDHTFQIPVDIYPLKKTYALTDTIWLETDIQGKTLFDSKTNQYILADTGLITFGGGFNEFGTYITNPSDGFCDVITRDGVNNNTETFQWSTYGGLRNFGCGESSYRCKVGFKPKDTGAYYLILNYYPQLGTCADKIIPYYSSLFFQYKNVDLNLDVFDSLPDNDKGGRDGSRFYTDKINNREIFVFRVQ